jgi:hypothetical protein
MDSRSSVGPRKAGGKSILAGRRLAWSEEHGIVRHQGEQASQITGVDRIDPG